MNPISSPKARAEFFSLMDTVNQSHEPALIIGKRSNAVLIAEGLACHRSNTLSERHSRHGKQHPQGDTDR